MNWPLAYSEVGGAWGAGATVAGLLGESYGIPWVGGGGRGGVGEDVMASGEGARQGRKMSVVGVNGAGEPRRALRERVVGPASWARRMPGARRQDWPGACVRWSVRVGCQTET